MPIERKPAAYLVVTTVIWGASIPIIKYALDYIAPLDFLFYRVAFATILLTPIAVYAWKSSGEYFSVRRAILLTLLGVFGIALELLFLYLGLSFTLASRAALLLSLTPLVTRFFFALKTGKHLLPSSKTLLGIVCIGVGIFLVLGESMSLSSGRMMTRMMIGNICILLSVIAWSLYTVLSRTMFKKHTEKHSPITLFTLTALGATATLLPVIALTSPTTLLHPVAHLPGAVVPSLLYLVLLSSTLGYMTFEAGSKYLSLRKVVSYLYAQPLIGALLAIVWLSEPVTPQFLLAAGIIGCGIYLTEHRNQGVQHRIVSS